MQTRYLGVLLLLGAVWGASFLFIKIAVAEMPPEILVTVRLVVAALLLLGTLYARGLRLPARPRVWGDFLFTGVVGLVFPYLDRKSTRLNSSHMSISYAVFCLKK